MIAEIDEQKERVYKIKKQVETMEEKGYRVKDTVSGGSGGKQHFTVEGYPYDEYKRKKTNLLVRQQILNAQCEKLEEITNDVEYFINTIQKSKLRRIFRLYYIENLTWQQIANKMLEGKSADSYRKLHDRYLEKNEKNLKCPFMSAKSVI